MHYRHQIKGRYFLVLVLFLNIMTLLPVAFLIKNPTPHERLVMAGIWAYMALNTAGRCWRLWDVLPEPLSTYYNRFQNFLYRRRTGKLWLQRSLIVIFGINLGLGIATRFKQGHHGQPTGTGEPEQLDHHRLCGACSGAEALAVAASKGRTAMKNPIFWLALVAGNLAAAWIIVIWRYTGREHAEAGLMNSIPLVLVPVCALLVLALAVRIVGRVWKLATK
ncbi:MAG TPA: hypothetical protein VK788_26845 [Terriglobales bacterium]|jgi:hypothetical protein|nr:hypothetical protein [Terriglobales bacterium]